MLEEDRTAICGPRYTHDASRAASRAGTVASEVVLGGRKVAIRRPRVRGGTGEVPLPTFRAVAHTDPLNRRVVEQMLVGVATRRYARSLEPLPAPLQGRGTSKSTVSRRFVAKTTAQLAAWQSMGCCARTAVPGAGRPEVIMDTLMSAIESIAVLAAGLAVRVGILLVVLARRWTRSTSRPSSSTGCTWGITA